MTVRADSPDIIMANPRFTSSSGSVCEIIPLEVELARSPQVGVSRDVDARIGIAHEHADHSLASPESGDRQRQFGVVGLDSDEVRGAAGGGHVERLANQRRPADHFENVVGARAR